MMPTKTFYFAVGINVIALLMAVGSVLLGNWGSVASMIINGGCIAFLWWRRVGFLQLYKETIDGWEKQKL